MDDYDSPLDSMLNLHLTCLTGNMSQVRKMDGPSRFDCDKESNNQLISRQRQALYKVADCWKFARLSGFQTVSAALFAELFSFGITFCV